MAPFASHEGAPCLLDQLGQPGGFRRDREHARVDAACIERVAYEGAHVVGLFGDDTVELAHLGRVEHGVLQQRRRRALYGGERYAQLVAHQAQEVGAHLVNLVERSEVLQGHHDRGDGAAFVAGRRCIDERPDAAPVRHREHHLLGA